MEEIVIRIEKAPETLLRTCHGAKFGKMVVKVGLD